MRKTLLSGTLTIMLLIGIVAPAFAWTNLGDYWPTQSYTPNHGNKWGADCP